MTTRAATIEADLAIIPNLTGVSGRTVVALPPSDADPLWNEMRVFVGGVLVSRAFDPGEVIVTGAPLMVLTEGGEDLLTEAGDNLTTETAS